MCLNFDLQSNKNNTTLASLSGYYPGHKGGGVQISYIRIKPINIPLLDVIHSDFSISFIGDE